MLSHPFKEVEDLLQVDGLQAETFQEAYEVCCDNHQHPDDFYDPLLIDDGDGEPDNDNDFVTADNSQSTTEATLLDFERYGLARPGNDLGRREDNDDLGERIADRQYDWSTHVGKYTIDSTYWNAVKHEFPAHQVLPSLNDEGRLNPQQPKIYRLIVDHYAEILSGHKPPQLCVNLDGVAGTGKTYVLLQASSKVEQMAIAAGRKDPVFRAAPTGIASHNLHGRTLYSLFKLPGSRPLA